jgi:hypothetical protein
VTEVISFQGTQQSRCLLPPTWRRKHNQFPKRCFLVVYNSVRRAKPINPAILRVIHHRRNPLDSTPTIVLRNGVTEPYPSSWLNKTKYEQCSWGEAPQWSLTRHSTLLCGPNILLRTMTWKAFVCAHTSRQNTYNTKDPTWSVFHVEFKRFWRCITLRITGFMDFVHRPEF